MISVRMAAEQDLRIREFETQLSYRLLNHRNIPLIRAINQNVSLRRHNEERTQSSRPDIVDVADDLVRRKCRFLILRRAHVARQDRLWRVCLSANRDGRMILPLSCILKKKRCTNSDECFRNAHHVHLYLPVKPSVSSIRVPTGSRMNAIFKSRLGIARYGLSTVTPPACSFFTKASRFFTSKPMWSIARPLVGAGGICAGRKSTSLPLNIADGRLRREPASAPNVLTYHWRSISPFTVVR